MALAADLNRHQLVGIIDRMMHASCLVAALEVVAVGRRMGLSLAALTEAINSSTARSRISQVVLPAIAEGEPWAGANLHRLVSDLNCGIDVGMGAEVPLPIAGIARSVLQVGVNTIQGSAGLDGPVRLMGSMAGTRLRDAPSGKQPQAEQASLAGELVVGYVGLGVMGGALARRLMLSRQVHVFDVMKDRVYQLAAEGAIAEPDLPSLARACDVIITCLPSSTVVREVLFGEEGLAKGLAPGKVVIDQTTGDPNATRAMAAELQARGVALLDAPVSGGPDGAAAGTIATLCGGPIVTYARVRSILEASGPAVIHFGQSGNGHVAKLIKNTLGSCHRLIAYEGLALGIKAGLSPGELAAEINNSVGWTYRFENLVAALGSGSGFTKMRIELMVKDLQLACKQGSTCEAPMFLSNAVRSMFEAGANELGGSANVDEMLRLTEAAAGVRFPGLRVAIGSANLKGTSIAM